jgi:hypothetical protein
MNVRSIARSVPMLAVIALTPSAFAAGETVQQLQMEREGIQLVGQLEEVARDVRYHADRLTTLGRTMQISKWTHVHHLDQIKSLVNEGLRPALSRLTEIQPQLPEWKQESIDKMLEAARMLAADANSAVIAKNEAGALPPAMNAAYKELVARIFEHAEALVKTSDAAGAYAAARLKAAEAGLKVPQK